MLIRNARIVSGFGAGPASELVDGLVDVLVDDGTILSVAPAGTTASPRTNGGEIDADGRWIMPGLWDHHTHLTQWTLGKQRLDLSGTRSPDEVVTRVADRIAQAPGAPVVAMGMKAGEWDRMPALAELDRITGDLPVICLNVDLHQAWPNTAARRFFGVPEAEADPESGFITENTLYDLEHRLVDLGSEPVDADFAAMLRDAVAMGITGLVDLEHSTQPGDWPARAGCDLVRIRWNTYANGLDAAIAAGMRTGDVIDGLVTVGGLKVISDGSLGTRTAWCCQPYADTGTVGAPNQSTDELRDLLVRSTEAGLEVACHAIGDRACAEALSLYAETGARGAIEHAQLLRPDDIALLARLGLRASVQPAHLLDDRDQATRVWPGRDEDCYAFASMLAAGVHVVFGSDAPVAPLDPWLAISAAVHRSDDDREPWGPGQTLTVTQALKASVMTDVAAGQSADLILLDADPHACDSVALRGMPVSLTMVAGRITHGG